MILTGFLARTFGYGLSKASSGIEFFYINYKELIENMQYVG